METLTGTPVTLICETYGYPTPKVTWSKGGVAITMETDERLTITASALTIREPKADDSALYVCTASNSGGGVSVATNVTFRGKSVTMATTDANRGSASLGIGVFVSSRIAASKRIRGVQVATGNGWGLLTAIVFFSEQKENANSVGYR